MAALESFCEWLQDTPVSIWIQSTSWVVPGLQTVHILAIGAVIVSGLVTALRPLGWSAQEQPLSEVAATYAKVLWRALPVLLATGILLIVAEPARSLTNPAFLVKMGLLGASIGLCLGFELPLARDPSFWEISSARKRASQALALTALVSWVGVIFAGRWIAYVQAS